MTTPSRNGKAVGAADRHLANRAINRSDLSSGAKSFLLAIADKAGHGSSTCTACYGTLAKMTSRSRRQVIYHMKALSKRSWITVEKRRDQRRGDLTNEVRMGPQFDKAIEEQRDFERKIREENRSRRGKLLQVLDRGAMDCTPRVQSAALPGCNGLHPNDSVLTTPLNAPSVGAPPGERSLEEQKCLERAEQRWGPKGAEEAAKLMKTYPAAIVNESMESYTESDEYFNGSAFQEWARESRISPGVFRGHPPFDPRQIRAFCQHRFKQSRQSSCAPIKQNCNPPAPIRPSGDPVKPGDGFKAIEAARRSAGQEPKP